ncbi:MAG TPA: hypothetical protein VMR52_01600 [Dehalococcoidia bacterium]|nr:hypothetical protein [Dehalococcoidia bacterium]
MTLEARLAFIVFFFLCWTVMSLIPWAAVAVYVRGRGALLALPLAVLAAWAAGIAVPLLGWRDATGFFVSLGTAFIGGLAGAVAGVAFARRLNVDVPRPVSARRARLDS